MTLYLIGGVFLVGLWGLLARRNLIKKVMALNIASTAIVLFFVYYGSLSGSTAPIVTESSEPMVDPVPQALMLTAIVVGVCVVALGLALVYRLYQRFKTLDLPAIERQVWRNE